MAGEIDALAQEVALQLLQPSINQEATTSRKWISADALDLWRGMLQSYGSPALIVVSNVSKRWANEMSELVDAGYVEVVSIWDPAHPTFKLAGRPTKPQPYYV